MKIKRYIGNTAQEAINKLKRELGPDTVILHTRKIKKPGIFGFFKKPLVEVVVALEESEKNIKDKSLSQREEKTSRANNDFGVNEELKKLRKSIETLLENNKDINSDKKDEDTKGTTRYLNNIAEALIDRGVDKDVAYSLLNDINSRINIIDKEKSIINEIVQVEIKNCLGESSSIKINDKQKVIFFIGPTGVGKTTTLAKLAANFVINENKNVGLITTDTYRIAAVEQLKTYSEILRLPLEIVYDLKEMYGALSNFKEKDLILIDTAGRNIKDDTLKDELKELIDSVNNKEIYLALSATTDLKIILSIIKEYSFIENFKLLFTKVDELDNYGVFLNVKYHVKNPLSYLTIGQNVPEDIEVADIRKITNILTKELENERSS